MKARTRQGTAASLNQTAGVVKRLGNATLGTADGQGNILIKSKGSAQCSDAGNDHVIAGPPGSLEA